MKDLRVPDERKFDGRGRRMRILGLLKALPSCVLSIRGLVEQRGEIARDDAETVKENWSG
jgi:hypothetical protein